MSAQESEAPPKNDFLIHLPDRIHASTLQTRMSNLSAHLSHNKPLLESGTLILSGPTLTNHSDQPLPITGSVLIYRTGTEDDVRDLLAQDPLWKADVWDKEKMMILAYRVGLWRAY